MIIFTRDTYYRQKNKKKKNNSEQNGGAKRFKGEKREMDYRVFAVDELKNLKHYQTAEKVSKIRIIEMETRLKSVKGISGMGENASGKNKTEQRWLSLISSIEDERERLESAARKCECVESALSAVSEEERGLLEAVYVNHGDRKKGKSIEEYAEIACMSRSTAYRLRDEAVINFTRAMYGAVIT